MKKLEYLLENNRRWAAAMKEQDATFFSRLACRQMPKILWIGCSDSRVPANQIVGLPPGEMFVHRNIANVVVHSDLNCLSVMHYAVEVLCVQHIIVCGHYGCGGVAAAMEDKQHGLIDNWLHHIKDVRRMHAEMLAQTPTRERLDVLCELNVREQLQNVAGSSVVRAAWHRRPLELHGWIYDIQDGIIKELQTIQNPAG